MASPYHPDSPDYCPPDSAQPFAGSVLRAAKSMPPGERDLQSIKELGRPCDPKNCKSWGLSVWLKQEDAQHARDLVPFFRKCYIVTIKIGLDDGVLLATPTNDQPGHHTFWKKQKTKLLEDSFSIAIDPLTT